MPEDAAIDKGPAPGLPAIPAALSDRLSALAKEARTLLAMMHSVRRSSGAGPSPEVSSLYRASVSRFKRVASELTHRFDTMSHFVGRDALDAKASELGCRWDPSARKLVVSA